MKAHMHVCGNRVERRGIITIMSTGKYSAGNLWLFYRRLYPKAARHQGGAKRPTGGLWTLWDRTLCRSPRPAVACRDTSKNVSLLNTASLDIRRQRAYCVCTVGVVLFTVTDTADELACHGQS